MTSAEDRADKRRFHLLSRKGRRFFRDLALPLQPLYVAPQRRQLLALLVPAPRLGHLDADADVGDRLGEGGVERLDRARHHSWSRWSRAIEHGQEWQSTEGDEVPCEPSNKRLDELVLDDREGDEARVFEP